MKRQNLRTLSLIVFTFTYLLCGAAVFGWLESDYERVQKETLQAVELMFVRRYNISEEDLSVLTTTLLKSYSHKAGTQWKFPGAFYFATTVVTTIGYGHSTPTTFKGRIFCMCYALVGIPLGLVMFQSIGERLNTIVRCALERAKRFFKAKNPEVTQTNLVAVVLALSTILMTSMAKVFAIYERWDYFDAFYYCFITLTTIGFGDYVALQKDSALQTNPQYVVLSLVFILFGLSVVSSAVNLLVLKFLTLNTEDERRDEQLRYTANMNSISLEGDVITPAAIRQQLQHPDTKRRTDQTGQDDDSTGRTSSIKMRTQTRRPSPPPPPPPFHQQHHHCGSRRAALNDSDDNNCERQNEHHQNRDTSSKDRTESNTNHGHLRHGRAFLDTVSLAPEVAGGHGGCPSGSRRRTDSSAHQHLHHHDKRTRHRCQPEQRPLDGASLSLKLASEEPGTCTGARPALVQQQSCLSSSSSQPPQEALAYWCESLCDRRHHHNDHHLHASSIVIDDCNGDQGHDERWPHYSNDDDDDDDGRDQIQHLGGPLEQLSLSGSATSSPLAAGQQVGQAQVHLEATQRPADGLYHLSAGQTCRHGRRPASEERRSASGSGANTAPADELGQLAQTTPATFNVFRAAPLSLSSPDEAGAATNSKQPSGQANSWLSIVSLSPAALAAAPASSLSSSSGGGGQPAVSSGYCVMAAAAAAAAPAEYGGLHGDCRQRRRHRHQRDQNCSGTTTAAAASFEQRHPCETAALPVQQDAARRQRAGATTMRLPLIGAASASPMSRADNGLATTFGPFLSSAALQPVADRRVPVSCDSGASSARRTQATKTRSTKSSSVQRLTCKCCCQHLECIQQALSSPNEKEGEGQPTSGSDKTSSNYHHSPGNYHNDSGEDVHDHHNQSRHREANLSSSAGDLRTSKSSVGQPEVASSARQEAQYQLQQKPNQQCEEPEIFSIQTSSYRRLLPGEQNEENPGAKRDLMAGQTPGGTQ